MHLYVRFNPFLMNVRFTNTHFDDVTLGDVII